MDTLIFIGNAFVMGMFTLSLLGGFLYIYDTVADIYDSRFPDA